MNATFTAETIKGMTPDQIAAVINGLSGKLDAKRKLTFKVSEKGAISVYGLNVRFPVTLYVGQWERLLAAVPELTAFIKANDKLLSRKAD